MTLDLFHVHTFTTFLHVTHFSTTAVYFFLSGDLSHESLSKTNEQKRTKFAKILEGLLNKIEASHSVQNSDTPSRPPPPPVSETTPPKPEPPPIPDHEPTDYLAFEPSQVEGEEPQEVYEAMEPENEMEQDLYEAPGKSMQWCILLPVIINKMGMRH